MSSIVLEEVKRESLLDGVVRGFLLKNPLVHNFGLSTLNLFSDGIVKDFHYCTVLRRSVDSSLVGFAIYFDFSAGLTRFNIALSPSMVDKLEVDICAELLVDDLAHHVTQKTLSSDFGIFTMDHIDLYSAFIKSYNAKATTFKSTLKLRHGLNLYRLLESDLKVSPPPPNFTFRLATLDDLDIVALFSNQFSQDIHDPQQSDEIVRTAAKRSIEGNLRFLLLNSDGRAVSFVGIRKVSETVRSIGPVFTPLEDRRNGYAKIATSTLCRRLFDEGGIEKLMLFADAANLSTNKLYSEIGFVKVGKCASIDCVKN